jgi:tetratricopeptide (TPR) repeat protein
MLLALSGALVAGCYTARHEDAGTAGSAATNAASARAMAGIPLEQLARAHAHYGAGVIHDMNNEGAAALEEYSKAAIEDPREELLVLEVSGRLLQSNQAAKAVGVVPPAAERPDASGAIYARLGLIYSQLGKADQAVEANRMAIKRAPQALVGYQNLYVALTLKKQNDEAYKALEEAEKHAKSDPDFMLSLCELYSSYGLQAPSQKSKADARALSLLKQVDKLGSTNAAVQLKLADGYILLGASERAARIYQELLKTLPDAPQVRQRIHARLADIYLRSSDSKHAAEHLREVIKNEPTNPQANYWLGSIAFEERHTAEAVEFFSKTTFLNPDFEPAYYDLASAQLELKKTSEALATLEAARRKFRQSFLIEYLTAIALGQQKSFSEAIPHYTSAEVMAKASDPKRLNHLFYFQFGAAWERLGKFEEAEHCFRQCLEMAPNFDDAQNYLGYMWAEHGTKLEEAKALIQKAVKADPKNAAYQDSLGWVLFKLGEVKASLEPTLKAIALSEEPDATVYDHLGDIYQALKEPVKAREAWQKSLSIEPNEEVRKKLEAK